MQDLRGDLSGTSGKNISDHGASLTLPRRKSASRVLERESVAESFWQDSQRAQDKMKEMAALKGEVDRWRSLESRVEAAEDLAALAIEENDDSVLDTLSEELADLTQSVADLEFTLALSGPHDRRDAILAIHAGAGGVDSQDWAQMLMRMYLRWAE